MIDQNMVQNLLLAKLFPGRVESHHMPSIEARCFVSGMMSLQKLPHELWYCSSSAERSAGKSWRILGFMGNLAGKAMELNGGFSSKPRLVTTGGDCFALDTLVQRCDYYAISEPASKMQGALRLAMTNEGIMSPSITDTNAVWKSGSYLPAKKLVYKWAILEHTGVVPEWAYGCVRTICRKPILLFWGSLGSPGTCTCPLNQTIDVLRPIWLTPPRPALKAWGWLRMMLCSKIWSDVEPTDTLWYTIYIYIYCIITWCIMYIYIYMMYSLTKHVWWSCMYVLRKASTLIQCKLSHTVCAARWEPFHQSSGQGVPGPRFLACQMISFGGLPYSA